MNWTRRLFMTRTGGLASAFSFGIAREARSAAEQHPTTETSTYKTEKQTMPLARIDLIAGKPEEYRRIVGDVVYEAMVDILKAPEGDRFQVINEHPAANFIFDPHFFGIERSADCIFIQLTLVAGRTLEQKRGFYKKVADELNRRLGIRREDVFINLVPVDREDWSFGNGEASLVKGQ
jgi:4-oxalocrotonate tautomerase